MPLNRHSLPHRLKFPTLYVAEYDARSLHRASFYPLYSSCSKPVVSTCVGNKIAPWINGKGMPIALSLLIVDTDLSSRKDITLTLNSSS